MKIGVISDTHLQGAAAKLPKQVCDAFKTADLILHAGDLIDISLLDQLKKIARTEAVCGNMDTIPLQRSLPSKKIIDAEGFKIGLVHGSGPPSNIVQAVKKEFTEKVDAIVFGHSHSPLNEVRDGVLFFNPGSPTDKLFAKYNSYGILTIDGGIKGEIVRL